jgi:hypothetical protein
MLEVQVMLVVVALWGDAEELLKVPMPSLHRCQAFARLWNARLPGIGASCVVVQRGVKITSGSRHRHSDPGLRLAYVEVPHKGAKLQPLQL